MVFSAGFGLFVFFKKTVKIKSAAVINYCFRVHASMQLHLACKQASECMGERSFVFSDLCLGCHGLWEVGSVGGTVAIADCLHVALFLLM